MAFLGKTYNTADLPEAQSYEPLPEGWYQVSIKDAELKTTKAGTGQYISVQYTVTGPTHQGRVVFGNINIENPNPKAEEIGLRDFNALMTKLRPENCIRYRCFYRPQPRNKTDNIGSGRL